MNQPISSIPDPRLERNLRGLALALLLIGCLVVLWPFISAILWAIVLSFTAWPIYSHVLFIVGGRRTLAALIMTIGTTVILLVPFLIVGFSLADDARALTLATRQWLDAGPPDPPTWLAKVPLIGNPATSYWRTFAGDSARLLAELKKLIEPASGLLVKLGLVLGHGIFELTLSILVAFFLYRDGVFVADRAKAGALRIGGERGGHLLDLAGKTVRSVVYGILGTALVQAILAGIGFLICRIPGAIVLALLTFFLSILPFGPPIIWIPAALWLFHKGQTGWGIFMIIWGILISSADNVVKPWLISQGVRMPFILILFGVLGGAMAFGLVGVFLGPTLLAVAYKLLQDWLVTKSPILNPTDTVPPL